VNEGGDVRADASRGLASRPVRADVEAVLAALDDAAAAKARYIVHSGDSGAVGAGRVRGQQGKATAAAYVLILFISTARNCEGGGKMTRTTPKILGHIDALVIDTSTAPKTASAPAMGAGRVPPVRVTLSVLRVAVGETAADTIAHGVGRFAHAGRRVRGRRRRVTIFARKAAGVRAADGFAVVGVVACLVGRGLVDLLEST
jgi:hypothetical protein